MFLSAYITQNSQRSCFNFHITIPTCRRRLVTTMGTMNFAHTRPPPTSTRHPPKMCGCLCILCSHSTVWHDHWKYLLTQLIKFAGVPNGTMTTFCRCTAHTFSGAGRGQLASDRESLARWDVVLECQNQPKVFIFSGKCSHRYYIKTFFSG